MVPNVCGYNDVMAMAGCIYHSIFLLQRGRVDLNFALSLLFVIQNRVLITSLKHQQKIRFI